MRPAILITHRTFNAEYYSYMRKQLIQNYNNKRKRVFVPNELKKGFTNYGSFQNIDKIKWSPASYVKEEEEMKPVKKQVSSDDEWVDVKKSL